MSELAGDGGVPGRLEVECIERMYADELFDAVERAKQGQSTVITSNGEPVARIVPLTRP